MRHALVAAVLAAGVVGGCQTAISPNAATRTASVAAIGETAPVGTASADAADDPAIWRNRQRPAESLIVATDKKAGLYVYGLDGRVRSFEPAGRLNNVDLVDLGAGGVIVVASDRNDSAAAQLQAIGSIPRKPNWYRWVGYRAARARPMGYACGATARHSMPFRCSRMARSRSRGSN